MAVDGGRLTAWKGADERGLRFLPAPLDRSAREFSNCRALSAYRRYASQWLVFFVATIDGREGLHAVGFDTAGILAPLFRECFDRDSMAGPIGPYEIRWAALDAFGVFYKKGEELGYSHVGKGSLTILKETVSPPAVRVSGFSLQSVSSGGIAAFFGCAEARDKTGNRGILLFEVRGIYPSAPEFIIASSQSVSLSARMLADRDGNVSCVLQRGTEVRVLRRVPGAWVEGVSMTVPLDRYAFLPLQPPMAEGAFVLSSQPDGDVLYGAGRDVLEGFRLQRIAPPSAPGSIRLIPADSKTVLIGWNSPTPAPGFSVIRYSLPGGDRDPLPVPLPVGHRFLDAVLTVDREGKPLAVLVTEDGEGTWILRYRYETESGSFAFKDRRSVAADGAAGALPILDCARVGNALLLSGASGLFVLDELSDAIGAFRGQGLAFRGTDGSAYLLLDDQGTFSVLRMDVPED